MNLKTVPHRLPLGRQPVDYAFLIAVGYLALGWVYIAFSSELARELAPGEQALAEIEQMKGAAFMLVSAVLLFGFSLFLFRRLARTADRQLATQEALLASERRAMAGVLSLSVVHDCNNLLTVANAAMPQLEAQAGRLAPEGREALDDLGQALRQMVEVSGRMRSAGSRAAAHRLEPTALDLFMRDLAGLVSRHRKVRSCTLRVDVHDSVILPAYTGLLQDALVNLVVNAADATGAKGEIHIRILRQDGQAVTEVHDNGPGIPPEQRERIFDSYFTTKGDGTGLGLLSVRTCAEQHGGTVEVDSSPLGGACFRVRFPIRGEPVRAA